MASSLFDLDPYSSLLQNTVFIFRVHNLLNWLLQQDWTHIENLIFNLREKVYWIQTTLQVNPVCYKFPPFVPSLMYSASCSKLLRSIPSQTTQFFWTQLTCMDRYVFPLRLLQTLINILNLILKALQKSFTFLFVFDVSK